MSVITDYTDKIEAAFADIKDDLGTISSNATAAQTALQAQIADLQAQLAAAGATLSPADKAALDQTVADVGALATQADTAAGKVAAPPAPPVDTPPAA